MSYQVLSKHEQHEAYLDGWKAGQLDKKTLDHVSRYVLNSAGDFPLGCWSQQHA